MYKVYCDGVILCDSRVEELALINPVVILQENKAGSFTFVLQPEHPMYDAIKKRKSLIQVYRDDEMLFSGVCVEESKNFYNQKTITCEGELSFFNDSVQRPRRYQGMTVRGLLEAYVSNHNAQVEDSKRFTVGQVTVTDPNDYIYCYTNMESTMKCLKDDLVDDLGGFFRIRHVDGEKYLDYLADSPNTNSQIIKFGNNLMDFTSNIDSSEIATAIIPLGVKLEESTVPGLETRLTIESVNDGLDYVFSNEAVENYGWIYKTVVWDDVTTAAALKAKGEKYRSDIQFENMVIEAKAVDMHLTDKQIEQFKLSDMIRVVSAPHGLDRFFRLTKMTIYLNDPGKNIFTMGKEERVSLTTKSNQVSEAIKKAVESIVPASSILNQAVANATALITTAMGGYVYKTNSELYIMDTDDPKTAQKVWRWNINGLGYSSTGINGKYGLAMTMDGSIVADYIKGGVLSGIEINNGNGTFHVDSKGNLTSNSLISNNASITGGKFETKYGSDSVKVENGRLSAYFDDKKVLQIVPNGGYGENLASLDFLNGDSSYGTGYTSINALYAVIPQLLIGSGKTKGDWTLNVSGDAYFYGNIYHSSGIISTSDRDKKNSIECLNDEESEEFIRNLKPCKFKFNNGTSNRFHHGFIAQEVKEAMGLDDWGVYVENKEQGKAVRYEEMIADIVLVVQNLYKRIEELERRG